MTGEKELPGKIQETYNYIQVSDLPKRKNITLLFSYIFGLGSLMLFLLSHASFEIVRPGVLVDRYESIQIISIFTLFEYHILSALCLWVGFVWIALSYLLVLKYKKSQHIIYQAYIVMLVLFSMHGSLLVRADIYWDYGFSPIFILIPALLSIIYYVVYGIQYGYKLISKPKR